MAETRLVEGNRGGSALIHDGYKYQKNKKRNGFIYWRCWRKECRTSLIILSTMVVIFMLLVNTNITKMILSSANKMSLMKFEEKLKKTPLCQLKGHTITL